MKRWLAVLWLMSGCAQPSSLRSDAGGRGVDRDLGGHLQYEDGGTVFYAQPDLAGLADLSQPADLTTTTDLSQADLAGAPDMRCAATAENCFNDIDDDCNGKINDGCPDTITVGADVPLTAYGGSGGGPVSAHCPANQVVIGEEFNFDDYDGYVSGVGLYCSPVTLVRGTSAYTAQVQATNTIAQEFYGTDTDYWFTRTCDTTAFQVAWNTRMDTGTYVNGLGMDCGAGTLTLSATNQLSINFTNLGNGFGYDYLGGTQHPQACGPSQALVGFKGRIGGWADQLQPVCAPLVVNYK